ncbi:MAG TPA: transporter associated domain-containing protein, partial [Candidatus Nitrosotenuis sp.]|nr:transporter associated domain-containing protein [Candidatus Nitrosotenuis sp.]
RLDQPVTTIMRPAVSVPGSLPVGKLLAQMRDHRTRLVIVLDEYGGTAGMVSRGDLLERIMGEVEEYTTPEEERDIERLEDGTWRVSGLLLTEDIDEHLGISIKDEHNDTIGGVVFSRLGRKPEVNDEVEIGGYIFRVEALDGLRIDRLRVFPVQVSLEGHENGRLEPASASAGTEALRH